MPSDAERSTRHAFTSGPVVVRIARSREYLDAVQGEVRVSRWLSRTGFPVTRVVDDLEQPVVVDGHPVTFWHVIEEGPRKPTYGELGAVLRDLHSLTVRKCAVHGEAHVQNLMKEQYGAFVGAYGRDLRGRPGFPSGRTWGR
ncbi:hypothetical protein DMH18_24515 [Streptomyces sp. WAC 06783]|uniref:phosphotransferase n=1 Tax=Streptomyces sp. WAC 06783 TaxID=2203211 RepID=UPI000F7499E9|nr:phosphotransferase [Streptomyces sp. WAC 06783]RSO07573.1 hypothetical protein DMH18_24515 [Streptomyces sp. WAC 06783]